MITGPFGLLLFACMFLPAVRACDAPVYPIEVPTFLPPYLFGGVLAIAAVTLSVRGLRAAIIVLRAITVATLVAGAVTMFEESPLAGAIEMSAGVLLLAAIGWRSRSERRAAATAVTIGAITTPWFAMWVVDRAALIGVYLSLAGALGLLVGGLVWLGETKATAEPAPHAWAR